MNEQFQIATESFWVHMGQDRPISIATKNKDGVAVRTVNAFYFQGACYFVTEAQSNKLQQILADQHVAICVDALQMSGLATTLGHPASDSNQAFVDSITTQLPGQFDRYMKAPVMRLVKIEPQHASYLDLKVGKGYAINFETQEAFPISYQQ